jgi:protein involved in polysaccharide export with SLBB domain
VQLVLAQPAIFRVYVNGEVSRAGESSAWALSRLSSLTARNTAYTSTRDISIKSSNGQTRVYDLFKAWRLGDISQDPYLRPGDVITFNRIKRIVTISGAVERPGRYQLLEGENIKELIEFYGNGFTSIADKTRLEMVRLINGMDDAGEKKFLTENDFTGNYVLEHYDAITVPTITQLRPVMFVEGAVANVRQALDDMGQSTASEAQDLTASNRLVVQFVKGNTYASLVRGNKSWFTTVSDTENAYILRDNVRIYINLNSMLYDASYYEEVLIQENDVLVIPFKQYFVTVAGAVYTPGRYPYVPDREWDYYIALAGGFLVGRNTNESVTIIDINGKRKMKTEAIGPETVITANTNHLLYYWNQYAPVVTTVLSVFTTLFTVILMTR